MLRIILSVLVLAGCTARVGPEPIACTPDQLSAMIQYISVCKKAYEERPCFDKAQEAYCKKDSK
jgi:hypothetical protein